jgi:hypothetical protein
MSLVSAATVPLRAAPAPLRAARGSVVAAVGLLVAVAGHGLAASGAASPGPLGIPMALLVLAGCVVGSARAWTAGRLVAVLLGIQVVAHLTMLLGTPSAQVDPRLVGLATAASEHDHGHAAALTPSMLAAHLVAVAVAALVLARVDAAVTVLWHLAGRLLLPARVAALRLPSVVRVPVDEHLRPARAAVRATSSSRRGPPALLARA